MYCFPITLTLDIQNNKRKSIESYQTAAKTFPSIDYI